MRVDIMSRGRSFASGMHITAQNCSKDASYNIFPISHVPVSFAATAYNNKKKTLLFKEGGKIKAGKWGASSSSNVACVSPPLCGGGKIGFSEGQNGRRRKCAPTNTCPPLPHNSSSKLPPKEKKFSLAPRSLGLEKRRQQRQSEKATF